MAASASCDPYLMLQRSGIPRGERFHCPPKRGVRHPDRNSFPLERKD
ncbi:MAG: hypothetical protein ACXQS8_06395 [Candidatus Helarchaeales archaeon]